MHELTVETTFAAAHAIVMRGEREPLHGHNWRVRVTVRGAELDDDGLLCDFHLVETSLRNAVAPFHNSNLNDTPPFDRINPTAERVSVHIAGEIASKLPRNVRIARVAVTEAPGCEATYYPPV